MKISFHLQWIKGDNVSAKAFKSKEAFGLFCEYVNRISKFVPCAAKGRISVEQTKSKTVCWVCDRSDGSRVLSSEETARALRGVCDAGRRELQIVIGGPDGFSKEELSRWKPDLVWSFGPLTFPHELAAVVAGEQVYRAWTILKRLPYHTGH